MITPQIEETERFLTRETAEVLTKNLRSRILGGGMLDINIDSLWNSNVSWGNGRIDVMGEQGDTFVSLVRHMRGNSSMTTSNEIDETSLLAALRRTEMLGRLNPDRGLRMFVSLNLEEHSSPDIWSPETYNVDPDSLAGVAALAVVSAKLSGFSASGFVQCSAYGQVHSKDESVMLYYPSTKVEFSLTVRSEEGKASGWAGTDNSHWNRIDFPRLIERAVEKCRASHNPVLLEPGRYTVVLEPQAVADFFSPVFSSGAMSRRMAEDKNGISPFSLGNGDSKLGLRIFDPKISITSNPMDPELGFPPFDHTGAAYHPAVWFENGVLKNLVYDRYYAVENLGSNAGLPSNGSYRIAGSNIPIENLISGTNRGLLITRFSNVSITNFESLFVSGYTRDGIWLITNGKIQQPVVNFRFEESLIAAFNKVDQIGQAERVYSPYAPVITPSMRVREFNMVGLSQSV